MTTEIAETPTQRMRVALCLTCGLLAAVEPCSQDPDLARWVEELADDQRCYDAARRLATHGAAAGTAPGQGGFDLAALNIQRGRDHGIPSLNGVRRAFGLRRLHGFHELTDDAETRRALATVYASVDEVDAWIGGLSEDHVRGAMVGPTFHRVLVDQFERLRDGDRFYYRTHLPPALRDWVEGQSLAEILRRNTGLGSELPDRVFETAGL